MRRLAWLLALLLWCVPPGRVLADSHHLADYGKPSSSCVLHAGDDDSTPDPSLQCTVGMAVTVSAYGMRVRPFHGSVLRLRFDDGTLFETDSGEGVLDGLVAGDYVCVAFTSHARAMTADVVLFDPEMIPCAPRRHRDLAWGKGSHLVSYPATWPFYPVWKAGYRLVAPP